MNLVGPARLANARDQVGVADQAAQTGQDPQVAAVVGLADKKEQIG